MLSHARLLRGLQKLESLDFTPCIPMQQYLPLKLQAGPRFALTFSAPIPRNPGRSRPVPGSAVGPLRARGVTNS